MNLYIIRHGESTWNSQNRIQGYSDPKLSKHGIQQARLLAGRFKKIKIDKVYSSPLLRARQTAQVISRALKSEIVITRELREVGLGIWEGKTTDEVDRLHNNSYQKWLKLGPTKTKIEGAESIKAFRRRVVKGFREIIRRDKEKNVAVVTHGGVIAAFLAHILDADFDRIILNLHLPNTCVTLVSFYKKKGFLVHVADTVHLSKRK